MKWYFAEQMWRSIFIGILLFIGVFNYSAQAQLHVYPDTLRKDRLKWVGGTVAAGYTVSMVGLYQLWYSGYDQTQFHFFNDNDEWLQMDKLGHAQTAYFTSELGYEAFRWTGLNDRKAIWLGASTGWVFLSTIEVFDGFSSKWGFSWGDMVANTFGSALFISQQIGWNEQRIRMKFSYSPTDYAQYREDALGATWNERILKDYNGQTYWLSANLKSFTHWDKLPPWLCVSIGYGGKGMLGGKENPDEWEGVTLPQYDRVREYYLSLDVDLRKIKTSSHFLKATFTALGFIKIPAPTISVDGKGVWRAYPVYF